MPSCLIIGECMVELAPHGIGLLRQRFAGDTLNTAVYLKRCFPECDVNYYTAVGTDSLSSNMMSFFATENINTQYVVASEDKTVGLYLVNTDEFGERSFSYWRSDSAARQLINLKELPETYFDIVYVSGITLAILDDEQRSKLFNQLMIYQAKGVSIVFDPNYRHALWENTARAREWTDRLYGIADIAFPGADDHFALYDHKSEDEIFTYLKMFSIREIILKRGAESIEIDRQGIRYSIPVKTISKVVDTTSAGDAFIGGYLAMTLNGRSCAEAAEYASGVAGAVISASGAIADSAYFFQQVKPIVTS